VHWEAAVSLPDQAREKEQDAELEAARVAARAAGRAFGDVRQQRIDAFQAAFGHIAEAIDPIFKDLTRSRCGRGSLNPFSLCLCSPLLYIHCCAPWCRSLL
jgi:hypothetical protein